MTDLTPGKTASFVDGGIYNLSGGTLKLGAPPSPSMTDSADVYIMPGCTSATQSIDISLNGYTPATAGGSVRTVRIHGEVTADFLINYSISASFGSIAVSGIYTGPTTTITFKITYGTKTTYLNLVLDGNPYALDYNKPKLIHQVSGSVIAYLPLTTTPCYLPGTLVATPSGPVAVEALSVGDEVLTYQATGIEAVPLCWIGKKTVTATSAEERPVRVRANALADNSPSQDLLITPEHCLFLADHLIPARMLVNGSSIVIDEQDVFEVYHIETEHHAIIMANGALSETYLDTGNRLSFTQEGSLINGVFTPVKSWETDAAAPLGVARSLVEPVFTSLQERAAQLGYVSEGPSTPLTDDPDLHLLTSQGAKIRPIRRTLQGYVFELPAGIDRAWLCSRASRPSDTIGPFVNDRRNLGVLVGTIMVFESRSTQHIAAHLEDRTIEGWQSYENDTCRWTDGRALVQFAETTATSPSLVMIDIVAAGPYHTEPSTGFALSDELRAIA